MALRRRRRPRRLRRPLRRLEGQLCQLRAARCGAWVVWPEVVGSVCHWAGRGAPGAAGAPRGRGPAAVLRCRELHVKWRVPCGGGRWDRARIAARPISMHRNTTLDTTSGRWMRSSLALRRKRDARHEVTKYHSWSPGSGPKHHSAPGTQGCRRFAVTQDYNEVGLMRFPSLQLSECNTPKAPSFFGWLDDPRFCWAWW